jgi:hypothetical protein
LELDGEQLDGEQLDGELEHDEDSESDEELG